MDKKNKMKKKAVDRMNIRKSSNKGATKEEGRGADDSILRNY